MEQMMKVFDYEGYKISFNNGKCVMVNATEMARAFGKNVGDWLRLKTTNEFTEALSADMQIPISALIQVVKGGNGNQGTWMHEDVALEFARWLSPSFAIWCNRHIKKLLQHGMTATTQTLEDMIDNPDLIIGLATQIKKERAENERLRIENKKNMKIVLEKTEQLDESMEWYSIKRWAKEHGMNWRNISWRKMKALSFELGYEVKKIFDANYGEVNIYHKNVFEVYVKSCIFSNFKLLFQKLFVYLWQVTENLNSFLHSRLAVCSSATIKRNSQSAFSFGM